MKQYRFRALITFDPAAREDAAPDHLGGTRTCCLIQPSYHEYFPARISWDKELPVQPGMRAVVSVAVADGEAEAFFTPGQRFTIWADALIGQTIRPDRMIGHGVIASPASPPLPPGSRRPGAAPSARAQADAAGRTGCASSWSAPGWLN